MNRPWTFGGFVLTTDTSLLHFQHKPIFAGFRCFREYGITEISIFRNSRAVYWPKYSTEQIIGTGMAESRQEPGNTDVSLDQIVTLAENAAATIERLHSELRRRDQRIKQLEQSEAALQQAALRYQRMKSQLEAQSEAKDGFAANGTIYQTFDEAFDAAYPGMPAAQAE